MYTSTGTYSEKKHSSKRGVKNDHLGNVNVVISDKKFGVDTNSDGWADYYRADVRSVVDYYPFGSEMPGRSFHSTDYRFGYLGYESDNEIKGKRNSYTTEYRLYDSRLGRWLSVDPLARGQASYSPYKAFFNNPTYFIDPSGGTEEERKKAVEAALKKVGKKYKEEFDDSSIGKGQFDCSGLVRYGMMQNKTISDPYKNSNGNGVRRIVAGSTQIKSVNDIEVGNAVVIKSNGDDYGHIMLITNIHYDDVGNVDWYQVVHAEAYWENAKYNISGGGDVNEETIYTNGKNKDGSVYSPDKYKHKFYKWDTPDEPNKGNNSFSDPDVLSGNQNYVAKPDATGTVSPVNIQLAPEQEHQQKKE